jgi:AraC family transcriptional regulator
MPGAQRKSLHDHEIPVACLREEPGAPPRTWTRCPPASQGVELISRYIDLSRIAADIRRNEASRQGAAVPFGPTVASSGCDHGAMELRPQRARGGLAPWQEQRAKEILGADLGGNAKLPDLASACRLSPGHFSLAFKQTVGCPPHQWLLKHRVERAKHLMLTTSLSLSEIALAVGFADQSHFTRVFVQQVKATPAAWRRVQKAAIDAGGDAPEF